MCFPFPSSLECFHSCPFFSDSRYCTDTKTVFTTSVNLKNHISLMHGIKNPDLSQMPRTLTLESKKVLAKVYINCVFSIKSISNRVSTVM